jgi:hypothetical protein
MKPMRSFDWRAEPVDNGREELVAILNACRTNIGCSRNKWCCGGEGAVACDYSPPKPRTSLEKSLSHVINVLQSTFDGALCKRLMINNLHVIAKYPIG